MMKHHEAVKPSRDDWAAVRTALKAGGIRLTRGQRQHLAQAVADARAHGYSGHEEAGYNTCRCSSCVAFEHAPLKKR